MFINSTIFLACNDIFMDFYNYIELSDLDKAHCSKYETLFLWKAYCYIIFNHFTIMNFMVSTIFPHFNICTPFCLTQVGIVFLLAGKQMLHLIDRQNLLKCYLNLLSNSGRHMFIISNCASRKCQMENNLPHDSCLSTSQIILLTSWTKRGINKKHDWNICGLILDPEITFPGE